MNQVENLIGSTLQDHHLSIRLASSPHSQVYLGEHTQSKQSVALKYYNYRLPSHREQESFLQDVKRLQQMQHPHILPIVLFGIHQQHPYIATQFAPHRSLHTRMRRQSSLAFPMEEALTILSQTAQALNYAHQQNLIHASLTPHNILFNIDGDVLLTDFHLPTLTRLRRATPAEYPNSEESARYQAPEQAQGLDTQDSDQYALGCVAYALFTGHQPDFTRQEQEHILIDPATLNAALSGDISKAILKAASPNPAQRFSNIDAFIDALKVGVQNAPKEAQTTENKASSQKETPFVWQPSLSGITPKAIKEVSIASLPGSQSNTSVKTQTAQAQQDSATPITSAIPLPTTLPLELTSLANLKNLAPTKPPVASPSKDQVKRPASSRSKPLGLKGKVQVISVVVFSALLLIAVPTLLLAQMFNASSNKKPDSPLQANTDNVPLTGTDQVPTAGLTPRPTTAHIIPGTTPGSKPTVTVTPGPGTPTAQATKGDTTATPTNNEPTPGATTPPTQVPTSPPVSNPQVSYTFDNGVGNWGSWYCTLYSGQPSTNAQGPALSVSNPRLNTDQHPYIFLTNVSNLRPGQTLTAYVFVENTSTVQVSGELSIQDSKEFWYDSGPISLSKGTWNRLTYTIPSVPLPLKYIGIDLYFTGNGNAPATYIDNVSWQ